MVRIVPFKYTSAMLLYKLELVFTIQQFYSAKFMELRGIMLADYIVEKMYGKYGKDTGLWYDFRDKSEFKDIIDEMGLFLLTCV